MPDQENPTKPGDFGIPLGIEAQLLRATASLAIEVNKLQLKIAVGRQNKMERRGRGSRKSSKADKADRPATTQAKKVVSGMKRLSVQVASLNGKLRLR
jgi:hypothetical protein